MKKLLLIAGVLYLGNVAHAQITLSSSSYPASSIGTDSLKKTVYSSPFPSFAPMSGSLCDMTSLVDSLPFFFLYRVPGIATYDFADSNNYSFAGYPYHGNIQLVKNATSIAEYGTTIFKAAYDITAITAGPFDSLFIPSQMSLFSSAHERLHFPATLGSSWYSGWYADVNFEISITTYSLYHTPGIIRRYVYENNTVVGWGKIRINNAMGTPSEYLDVLQIKTMAIIVDSFFLSGSPMPPITLIALNLTQGKTDTTYTQNFYREREVTPLASVVFRDAGFTQPYKATTHVQRLWPAGVNELTKGSLSVFPNPVTGRTISVRVPAFVTGWSYELVDLSGSVVQSGIGSPGGEIRLNEAVRPGVYFLRLSGNEAYSRQIVVTDVP